MISTKLERLTLAAGDYDCEPDYQGFESCRNSLDPQSIEVENPEGQQVDNEVTDKPLVIEVIEELKQQTEEVIQEKEDSIELEIPDVKVEVAENKIEEPVPVANSQGLDIPNFNYETFRDEFHADQIRNPKNGWKEVKKNKRGTTIYSKEIEGRQLPMICAEYYYDDVNFDIAFDMFKLIDDYMKWNPKVKAYKQVRQIDANSDVIHMVPKMPAIITSREWVQYRKLYKDVPNKTNYIMFESIEDPLQPHKKGVIRAYGYGVFIIAQCPQNPRNTSLRYIVTNDLKGSIPKALLKMGATKPFEEWGDMFAKGYKRHISIYGI